jgi:type II secretory pathway pseudopilin PulG
MRNRRTAFTLVEMLVAMALTMFLMLILSQAFVAGLETFSGLKAIGDLQASLRVAQSNLQADLALDHFEARRKLSDPDIFSNRPREGYFFIRQGSLSVSEGTDADGLPSVRSANHVLGCTIKLRGNRREHYLLSPDVPLYEQPSPPPNPPRRRWSPLSKPGTNFFGQDRDALFNPGGPTGPYTPDFTLNLVGTDAYASQWAEVQYFLIKTGTSDEPTNPAGTTGTPLYGLYRSQYLLVPNNSEANMADTDPSKDAATKGTTPNSYLTGQYLYSGISCYQGAAPGNQLVFNSPADVADTTATVTFPTTPNATTVRTAGMQRRVLEQLNMYNAALPLTSGQFPAGSVTGTNRPRAATLVVPNVTSFNIQVLYSGGLDFRDLAPISITGVGTFYLYDTTLPMTPGTTPINGLKITIRVLDPPSGIARQMSMVHDM